MIANEKAELTEAYPSAARPSSSQKTRRFPPPSREEFGFVGRA